jgi:DNA-nicking Smr family endonuclease
MKHLDLHGETIASARRKVELFVNRNWGSGEDIEIITGHSQQMRRVVAEVFERYAMEWQVGGPLGVDDSYIRSKLR